MNDHRTHRRSILPAVPLIAAALLLAQGAAAQPAPDAPPNVPPQVAPAPGGDQGEHPPRPRRPERDGPPPRGERDRMPDEQPVSVTGTLQDFNLSPRGEAEGMILSGEGNRTVQVNFPPPVAAVVTQRLKTGESLSLMAVPRLSMPDHPVYDLVSVKVGDKEIKVPRPGDAKETKVEGTVKRLNYARDGRLNGAVLEDGEFVYVGPLAAERVKLAVGQKLTVEGMQIPSIDGGGKGTIEAKTVNGVAVEPGRGPRERPVGHGRGRGPGGPDGAPKPPPPPSQEQ